MSSETEIRRFQVGFSGAGHFVWEEEPAKYASAVLDSITGNRP